MPSPCISWKASESIELPASIISFQGSSASSIPQNTRNQHHTTQSVFTTSYNRFPPLVSLTTDEDDEDDDVMSFRRRQWTTDERVTDEHRRERRQQRSTQTMDDRRRIFSCRPTTESTKARWYRRGLKWVSGGSVPRRIRIVESKV
ncbi:hypothetical protein J8273_7862 [Carpediemonas membranifera]|uniref:Uncharacterized protein n=1 Tax=Carpediemonas membranifera TaxID=201153 RepID=A0A8J6APU7_9EUKA|nr:hypothetical protein J8273_7862 [Carpediemonas membranifera]|eukprot:KAG9390511.1 hypothetical protein J8273_7862 [Carpediemonas membranifera]